jgi:hypothetical protein
MELREDRTELERLLGGVWDYEDPGRKKTSLLKWLFALTLTGAVICTFSPPAMVASVIAALAPAPQKLSIDRVSSENVTEDLDYRIALHIASPAGWSAFLEAHPDGPHAQAARAEIGRPQGAPSPQPSRTDDTAKDSAPAPAPAQAVAEEPAPPPQPVEAAEQSPRSPAETQAPINTAQTPAAPSPPPVMAEVRPAQPPQPVEAAEQSPPSPAATPTPVNTVQTPAANSPPPVMAEVESEPSPQPIAVVTDAPLPPSRPRDIAAAKSVEPAHRSHGRVEHRQASQPNVLTVLLAQLFHRHSQRSDIIKTNGRSTSKAATLLVYGGRPD